ncbi:MAG: bifunctional methylenetetrahydrofolate dehydrogenase/methenyltetrahydrofolate cyclohydrolase FolD [Candidatus Hydrogenedentes bacterium]|nr:bifunctional methylenetetrahydrofolate dehydrogenase/methenyltetrahydrofolate cyclohydrolase FolD [Candidatus Hydrogenedentota bacterium]
MSVSRTAKIISGKIIADQIRSELIVEIEALRRKNVTPGLAVVLVGENPASQVYVRNKRKTCAELGLHSFDVDLPADVTERRLLASIDKLNRDPKVHGILVQMPLPKHLHEQKVLNAILPEKDVDGFHPVNAGKLLIGEPGFAPCTAAGCQELLLRSGYDPAGKHVVIVGRSNIVGKPLAALLMQKAAGANATVTVCHSRTRHLAALTRQADILVAAIGIPEFITGRMIKDKAVVIDVGINRIDDPTRASGTRLVGDVHFAQALKKARAITPVPGGVGLMTVIMLMRNTVSAAKQQTSR